MGWSPLSIIDAIDASPTIQRAKQRQEDESMPEAREIGSTGAKGGGADMLGAKLFVVIVLIGVIVVAISSWITAVPRG